MKSDNNEERAGTCGGIFLTMCTRLFGLKTSYRIAVGENRAKVYGCIPVHACMDAE